VIVFSPRCEHHRLDGRRVADRRDTDDDRRAALAQHVHGHPRGGPAAVGLEGEVGAAAGERLHARHRVFLASVHHVSGAEFPRELQRRVLDVHRDDRGGAGQPRALHDVEADATTADHRYRVARLHARVEDGGTDTGGDAAPDERQLGEVERGRRRNAAHLGHDRVLGEARHLAHVGQILAGQRVQARRVVVELAAGARVLVAEVRADRSRRSGSARSWARSSG
jgi:hypothetical protein